MQRLRGHGLVSEIHAPDLAFDVADVEALLRKTVGKNPPGLSRRVWEHTDGWPTAVHCAVEILRGVQADQRLDAVGRLSEPGERFMAIWPRRPSASHPGGFTSCCAGWRSTARSDPR